MADEETVYDGSDDSSETINYDEEVEGLSDGGSSDGYDSQLVSLNTGKNKLKIMSEGRKTTFNYGDEDNPDIQEKVVFDVELVEGEATYRDDGTEVTVSPGHDEDLSYAVTLGQTKSSQWGQLARLGKDRDGLEGEEVTIIRNGTGTDTTYTVLEAAEL